MRSRFVILLFAFVCVFIAANEVAWKHNMYKWDISGYYLYLPATFIYHDIGGLKFYDHINRKYDLTASDDSYGIYLQPTGRRLNKYAIGTCLFQLPFFLAAHGYCLADRSLPADGYSTPYQVAGILGNLFWVICGLFVLRRFLLDYFNDTITAFTLLCIAFGTNLYCYSAFLYGMSHTYGFFLMCCLLWFTDRYYKTKRSSQLYAIVLLLGLITITRPINIIATVIPVLWGVHNDRSLKARLNLAINQPKKILIALSLFMFVCMIQMAYWKYITGHWIYYSYEGEHFNFLKPHIIDGLFSYQKGWFIYTPVALISVTGCLLVWKYNKRIIAAILVFFAAMIYAVFSWEQWWYGGGYSARALIETLPILSIPLAYTLYHFHGADRHRTLRNAYLLTLGLLIALNIFQTYQFSMGVLHSTYMNKEYYWKIFGKWDFSLIPENERLH